MPEAIPVDREAEMNKTEFSITERLTVLLERKEQKRIIVK